MQSSSLFQSQQQFPWQFLILEIDEFFIKKVKNYFKFHPGLKSSKNQKKKNMGPYKVPFINCISTFVALRLIELPNFLQKLSFFVKKKKTLHFDGIFKLQLQIFSAKRRIKCFKNFCLMAKIAYVIYEWDLLSCQPSRGGPVHMIQHYHGQCATKQSFEY